MIIYLADLQNSYFRYVRNSVPIGMGYVASYLKKRFNKDVEIRLFRKFEEIYEAAKTERPDMAAFGSYCWNTRLTLNTARYIKSLYPETVIAIGGADVSVLPDMTEKDLLENPQVDFYMPSEGEAPAANLVEAMLSAGGFSRVRQSTVRGCYSLNPNSGKLWGKAFDRYEGDINELPSPYFDGWMDRFLLDKDYMASIQTSRGCPYRCTYCVSGRDTWNTVRPFHTDRVKEEIYYVSKRSKNSFLRFADENFGILERDVEIAEYVVKLKRETGFPQSGSIYTDKHPNDRIKYINWLMREIIPFCISFQTITPQVLKNIQRVNLKDEAIEGAVKFARGKGLVLVSELIFMLPGETMQTFLAAVDKLIDFRFESIEINPLHVLKGAVMDTPEYRNRFAVKTVFSMSENGYTRYGPLENIEIDEWVVENNSISREEHFRALRFIFLFDFAHYRSYFKEFLFFYECYGVKASRLLMEAVERPDLCPTIVEAARKYEQGIRDFLKESKDDVFKCVLEKIAKGEEVLGFYDLRRKIGIDLLMNDRFGEMVEEIALIGGVLVKDVNHVLPEGFDDEVRLLKEVIYNAFIPIHRRVPRVVSLLSEYNILDWIADNYKRPLSYYRTIRPMKYLHVIRGYDFYEDIWNLKETDLVKYRKAFRIFTSANRRRFIEKDSGAG